MPPPPTSSTTTLPMIVTLETPEPLPWENEASDMSYYIFIVSVCILFSYVCMCIWRTVYFHHRRRRKRILWQERIRLQMMWRQTIHSSRPFSPHDSATTLTPDQEKVQEQALSHRQFRYWSRRKRRRMLWQWSVAMGYCHYHHGRRMDALIASYLEREQP